MSVIPFPLPAADARELIRGLANTDKVHMLESLKLGIGPWPSVVMHRQIIRCLEDGEIVGGPTTNELGHYEFQMQRASSGQEIGLTVVLYKENVDWHVAVTEVSNGSY